MFLIAGIYGILVLVPQYFLKTQFGIDNPPAITHPEFYYGFVGLALVWQIVFIIISTNPAKYRVLMITAVMEKFFFVAAVGYLYLNEGMNESILAGATIDLILGIGFIVAYFRTKL